MTAAYARKRQPLVLALAAVLAGCSLALDGKAPPPGLQSDGIYALSDQEQLRSCEQLLNRSVEIKAQQQDLSKRVLDKVETEKTNPESHTTLAALSRLAGAPSAEAPDIAEYNRLTAELTAIDAARTRKHCAPGHEQPKAPK